MSMPALVSLDDFTLRVGTITPADEDRAQACLDDASALIRGEAGKNWTNDDGDELADVPDVIAAICVAVAIRAFRNPEGVRSETIGGYAVTYADASTAVYLTPGERAQVRRAAGRSSIGSVTLESPYMPDTVWVPVEGTTEPFPWDVTYP